MVLVGNIIGIANAAAAAGEDVDVTTTGVFELAKVGANSFAVGATVYWDATAKLGTSTASGNAAIGTAVAAAGSGGASVKVRLKSF